MKPIIIIYQSIYHTSIKENRFPGFSIRQPPTAARGAGGRGVRPVSEAEFGSGVVGVDVVGGVAVGNINRPLAL